MSLKFLNEGFELSQFNVLQESVVNQITSILNTLKEATMSDEDRRDNELLRQILSKASEASYDKRRALKWTPQELDIADKYNLTLPQRTTKWDGSKEITSLKDNDVDYERGFGRNRQVRNLEMELSQQRAKTNVADFIRKRKEKGPTQDRPYRQVDKYARVDQADTFGDTTFMHDNTGRFGQDQWNKKYNKAATLAGSGLRNSDLTDVEKDRVAVNKQMSQPVRDMKAALASRKENQKDLDNVNLNYARNVADARKRFDDAMAYADEQRQKESERGQQGVADATSRINKLLRKESLRRAIEEKLNSLNEAEMSDEDKHDSEILKQIFRKTQERANAALTPEEKAVLQKYNLGRDTYIKNVGSVRRDIPNNNVYIFNRDDVVPRIDSKTGGIYRRFDKINYADRARKRPERGENANRFVGDYLSPAPDYEREHQVNNDEYWNSTKYQRMERIADNQQMTKNVRNMKDILQRRKEAQQFVDNSQAEQDAEINKLKAQYESRIDSLKKYYDDANQNSKARIDRANNEIDALLKRGET
nr:MAG TPA: hypothetical protein [Caudoviricetes sp.]